MRVDLRELLRLKPIMHPTRLVSTSISQGCLRVAVRGFPWWRDVSDSQDEQLIEFLFEGLANGQLSIEDFGNASKDQDEVLETFEVCSLSELDWAQPSGFEICSGPLGNPLNLYLRVHDFLGAVDAYREPSEFLNYPSGSSLSSSKLPRRIRILSGAAQRAFLRSCTASNASPIT